MAVLWRRLQAEKQVFDKLTNLQLSIESFKRLVLVNESGYRVPTQMKANEQSWGVCIFQYFANFAKNTFSNCSCISRWSKRHALLRETSSLDLMSSLFSYLFHFVPCVTLVFLYPVKYSELNTVQTVNFQCRFVLHKTRAINR